MVRGGSPGFACPECATPTRVRDSRCPACGATLSAEPARKRRLSARLASGSEFPGEIKVVLGCSGCVCLQYLLSLVVFLFLTPATLREGSPRVMPFVFLGLMVLFGMVTWGLGRRRPWAWGFALGVWILVTAMTLVFAVLTLFGALSPGPTPSFAESWPAFALNALLCLFSGLNTVLLLQARKRFRRSVDSGSPKP